MVKARSSGTTDKSAVKQIKRNVLDDLAQSIVGKDKLVQVLRFSDEGVYGHVKAMCSTRSIAIDTATQVGGLPFGRLVEIFGRETSGKSSLTDHIMAQTQALGGYCAVYDSEEKKDLKYTGALGVDTGQLLSIQPENKTVEAAVESTRRALDHWIERGLSATPLTVVWDSVAAMPTLEEIENPTTKQPGVAAKELRRAMRQLITKIARAGALFVVINQQYDKIGAFGFGPKTSTYGGGGIRYQSTMRLELVRTGALKGVSGAPLGIEAICKVFKNGMAAPRDEAFAIEWGKGINNAWSILEKLKEARYITSGGGWYTFAMQGTEPVRWQGGWQGLGELFATQPELLKTMSDVFVSLPESARK